MKADRDVLGWLFIATLGLLWGGALGYLFLVQRW